MSLGKFIEKRRIELGYSQRQVALYSGLSNATISRIENKNVIPDSKTLKKLAGALNLTPLQLFEAGGFINPLTDEEMQLIEEHVSNLESSDPKRREIAMLYELLAKERFANKKSGQIKILRRIAAGRPIEAIEDIIDTEVIPVEWIKDGSEFFGLRIKGASMEPRIKEGDTVIVRKQPDVESGDVAVVLINGQDATVKKLVKHETGISLVPYNAVYDPKFYTFKEVHTLPIEIVGKVVELRGKI